jgi:uncharacterized membrane protein
MSAATTQVPAVVRLTKRIEQNVGLDTAVNRLRPVGDKLRAHPRVDAALRGEWLGHAVHPLLTDLPIGFWTSAIVLDALGGEQAQPTARKLVGLGVLAWFPTAWTGWAEWAAVTGQREQRVGVIHAVSNGAAIAAFATSWVARRRGNHKRGQQLALLGGGALSVGGYLGAHLIEVRKVSSSHPAFD